MATENVREENQNVEVDLMHIGADKQGKVKTGKAARLNVITEERNDVVFIPAFEFDSKSQIIEELSEGSKQILSNGYNNRLSNEAKKVREAKARSSQTQRSESGPNKD